MPSLQDPKLGLSPTPGFHYSALHWLLPLSICHCHTVFSERGQSPATPLPGPLSKSGGLSNAKNPAGTTSVHHGISAFQPLGKPLPPVECPLQISEQHKHQAPPVSHCTGPRLCSEERGKPKCEPSPHQSHLCQ